MEAIIGLHQAIKKSQQNSQKRRESKIDHLYKMIENGENSNEVIRDLLFSKNKFPNTNFYQTKEALRSQLINKFLSINFPGSEAQEIYDMAYKEFTSFKILLGKGFRNAAITIAEKALKKAIKFHLTELIVSFSKSLFFHYSTIEYNKKKYNKYLALYFKHNKILNIESSLEQNLALLFITVSNKKKLTNSIILTLKKIKESSDQYFKQDKSYRSVLIYGNICSYYFQVTNNLDALIYICQKCNEYFTSLPQRPTASIFSFNFKMIPAYIKKKDYANAKDVISRCLDIPNLGKVNQERLAIYQTINYFHQGQFLEALQICKSVQKPTDEEFWRILTYYARLLSGEKIRTGKFLNEVPIFSKDKIGMNSNILIIQILSYLKRKEYDKIIDRLDAVKAYSYRHLKDDKAIRTDCFIQILLRLEKSYFNATNLQLKAKPYLEKLKQLPLEKSMQEVDLEIVPYEKLWEFVLKCLKK